MQWRILTQKSGRAAEIESPQQSHHNANELE
jgi:hypothetical protein